LLPPCHQIASNALFKGKIGGSRVAAKLHILAFSALKRTQNHVFFTFLGLKYLKVSTQSW
jgi:hypothetical protein